MRLALISQEYPPETAKGDLGTRTYLKAHGLAQRGHEVFVISRGADGKPREYWDGPVHVTRIPGFDTLVPLYTEIADWVTYSAQVSVAITARHAVTPLDLVDFPDWAAEGYVYLVNQTKWNRTANVVQLHGPLVLFAHKMHWPAFNSEFYRTGSMLEATCLRLADALYTSSQISADFARREYHPRNAEIPVIHAGVDLELFSPGRDPAPTRPTIVFAGRFTHNSGVFPLVEAALELVKDLPDLHVRFLGRADDTIVAELERRAGASGRPELLDFIGAVSHEKLPEYLRRAHVLAVTGTHEPGPGVACLEAMACGLPVIAGAGSGAAEIVHHERTGLLVPPDDKAGLVSALRQLLTDAVSRSAMGARARQYAVANFGHQNCLAQLERFYESVVHRHLSYA